MMIMSGAKLFILLYLFYMAKAHHYRTSLRTIPVRSVAAKSSLYSNLIKVNAQPSKTRLLTSVRGSESAHVSITKQPTVNPHRKPPKFQYLHKPNKQLPPTSVKWTLEPRLPRATELGPELESTLKFVQDLESITKPEPVETDPELGITESESEIESRPKLELESQSDPQLTAPELKHNSEPELDSATASEFELKLKPEPETVTKEPKVPIFRPRSPFSEPIPDNDPTTKSELESQPDTEPEEPELETKPENQSTTTLRPEENIQCKEENAYYIILNECDAFFECQKFVAKKRVCPDGLLFNSKAKWPRYPCSYPSEVACGNNTIAHTTFLNLPGECPRQFGSFVSNSGNCEKYIVCENGRSMHMSCPMGLAFNPKIGACDWPDNVPNCNPKVFKDFTCPAPSRNDKSNIAHNYRYKKSCKLYVACVKGEPRLLRCDSGLSFDDKTSRCISSDAVLNCKTVSEIVDTKLFISKVKTPV